MKFDLPKDQSSIIKVIGVGGGGGNAVNHMFEQGITGVDFIVCNTDHQALDQSPVPVKIQLGASLTEGRGAGSIPEVGRNAAIENIDDLKDILAKNTKMVFITAGMGGGTGTGAAPVIAQASKEMGILTVGIVTIPFTFEGRKRREHAEKGIEELRQNVDTLIIICNDRIREMYGNLSLTNAFSHADNVLATAAKGIAEVITVTGAINVDFEDVRTVMTDSGVAIMGSALAEGENRAIKAVEKALLSPLLNDNNIIGANYVLLNITYGNTEIQMDEVIDITDYIQGEAGDTADVIWGHGYDESLGDQICVTLIATGFKTNPDFGYNTVQRPERKVMPLQEEKPEVKRVELKENEEVESFIEEDTGAKDLEPFLKEQGDQKPEKDTAQRTIEFDLDDNKTPDRNTQQQQQDEPYLKTQTSVEEEDNSFVSDEYGAQDVDEEKTEDRINKLKELSMRLRSTSGLKDLENEPAYKRRKIKLDNTPHSSESNVSKFTLSEEEGEDGEKKTGLRENNSFLHDNVD
ncbi:MAG: cell division protein FtsZ [Flavobacteriales bacterium]|nr:cell division protein FtsZ [Flavobacteriales bacterium]